MDIPEIQKYEIILRKRDGWTIDDIAKKINIKEFVVIHWLNIYKKYGKF